MNGEPGDSHFRKDAVKRTGCGGDQLDLSHHGRISDDIDVTLGELTEASLLRTVRTEYIADLQCLEGSRQFVLMAGIIAAQRNRQIIAKRTVRKFGTGCVAEHIFTPAHFPQSLLQLTPSLLNLEDELLVLSSVFPRQVLYMFHDRSLDLGETVLCIGVPDDPKNMLPKDHILGKKILHALNRCLNEFHVYAFLTVLECSPHRIPASDRCETYDDSMVSGDM